MIISRTDALKLVADHSLVAALPSILPLVERYATEARALKQPGCRACDRRTKMAPLGDDVLAFLGALSQDDVEALRTYLRDPHLYVYAVGRTDRVLVELGGSN